MYAPFTSLEHTVFAGSDPSQPRLARRDISARRDNHVSRGGTAVNGGRQALRVAVVDGDAMLRGLVHALLEAQPGIEVVASAAGQREASEVIRPSEVDVALLNVELSDGNGIALGLTLQDRDPDVRILLMSSINMLALMRSVSANAPSPWSYLAKHSLSRPGDLVRALAAVARGRVVIEQRLVDRSEVSPTTPLAGLSAAQLRVLQLVAQGKGNGAVAEELDITPKAVEAQLTNTYKALDLPAGVNNRVAAVLEFLQQTASTGALQVSGARR